MTQERNGARRGSALSRTTMRRQRVIVSLEMTEGVRAPEGKVLLHDGVGMLLRGDVCLIVYQKPARIERTRWLFDVLDAALDDNALCVLGLMIVLPTSDPPDGPTRQENHFRLRKIEHRVKRLVTTPVGDAFKVSVVRAVMRGLNIVLGHSGTRFITDTVQEGIGQLLEVKTRETPTAKQILTDLRAIYIALGEPDPKFAEVRAAS